MHKTRILCKECSDKIVDDYYTDKFNVIDEIVSVGINGLFTFDICDNCNTPAKCSSIDIETFPFQNDDTFTLLKGELFNEARVIPPERCGWVDVPASPDKPFPPPSGTYLGAVQELGEAIEVMKQALVESLPFRLDVFDLLDQLPEYFYAENL